MEFLTKVWDMIWGTFVLTFGIAVSMFGLMFILGLLLYLFARFSRTTFAKTLGLRAEVFFTAWIGAPVHELGHALFCLLFGHKITKINLFTPNSKDGTLGLVEHSYNKKNLYHRIGSFFIGAGPIIFGALVILALLQFLLPGGKEIISLLQKDSYAIHQAEAGVVAYLKMIFDGLWTVSVSMFNAENIGNWQFWVFLFLTMSIAAHMELSPADLKEMGIGFLFIFLLMFFITLVYSMLFSNLKNILLYTVPFIAYFNQLLFFALMLSVIYFAVTYVVISFFTLIIRQKLVNPFKR
ncbi:MAG: hypothetical protein IH598_00255 [Bacteroidales bacterium]|nr:hypothetical protein [Bacteroidales bacterium]